MLKDDLRAAIKTAMVDKDTVARNVLKVALGEIGTHETRTGEALSDAEALKLVKKIVKANEETLVNTTDEATKAKLVRENEVLGALLPQALDVGAIVSALADVSEAIRDAKGDGPAMGIAMKSLKSGGSVVESGDVAAAIRRIRS